MPTETRLCMCDGCDNPCSGGNAICLECWHELDPDDRELVDVDVDGELTFQG